MRNPNHFTRFRLKQQAYIFIFLLSILLLLLSITTLSGFYPQNHLLFPISPQLQPAGKDAAAVELVDNIIEKLIDQIRVAGDSAGSSDQEVEIKNVFLKHRAFLSDMLGLMSSLKATVQAQRINQSREEPAEFFLTEEIRKYVRIKPNRLGKQNFMGANGTFMSIGHACFSMKEELELYMDYDVGELCNDDWKLAQRLMVHGCDPLPRRRCFARAPKLYGKPLGINESIWTLPDDRNVRWSGYRCKSFACLAAPRAAKGFFKCSDCFNLTHHERPRWMRVMNQSSDFAIEEVLKIKRGEIRIGLDFSAGTGTFAARMRELNVTIISATINLGAPFSETIALRGLLPLYLTINQRLPFFDNTLDIIHSTRFLDGWIDIVLLDFVLYDWDRVLRPGGLLWIDSFFCKKKDLEDYLEGFRAMRYRERKWVVMPKVDKDGEEVFFSAVLEKPSRPF